jgi:hypothetical protein
MSDKKEQIIKIIEERQTKLNGLLETIKTGISGSPGSDEALRVFHLCDYLEEAITDAQYMVSEAQSGEGYDCNRKYAEMKKYERRLLEDNVLLFLSALSRFQ